jgi:transcription antitermination factor NusG
MDKKGLTLQVPKWYALRTYHRRENTVVKLLEMEGITCFLPRAVIKREWSDRIKCVDFPLLPSMVLVKCPELRLRVAESAKGVIELVRKDGDPVEVLPESIEALRNFEIQAEGNFLVDGRVLDVIMGKGWVKKGRKVMMVDERYSYLNIPELDLILCLKK